MKVPSVPRPPKSAPARGMRTGALRLPQLKPPSLPGAGQVPPGVKGGRKQRFERMITGSSAGKPSGQTPAFSSDGSNHWSGH
jgi:hypothetical protein